MTFSFTFNRNPRSSWSILLGKLLCSSIHLATDKKISDWLATDGGKKTHQVSVCQEVVIFSCHIFNHRTKKYSERLCPFVPICSRWQSESSVCSASELPLANSSSSLSKKKRLFYLGWLSCHRNTTCVKSAPLTKEMPTLRSLCTTR